MTQRITIRDQANRVTRFLIVQFIALLGWILVQTFFSLSSMGRSIPFALMIVIEAIWWMGLLLIMLLLFLLEYRRFVHAALHLEEANRRLRIETNRMMEQMRSESSSSDSSWQG